jgi:capsular polysaccharide biosynthesis protein
MTTLERNGHAPTTTTMGTDRTAVSIACIRHPLLVLAPLLLSLLAGAAIGALHHPTYQAEARLLVGSVDVESRAVPGFVSATNDLAAVYARLVPTTAVADPGAHDAGVSTDAFLRSVTASPIPLSSIIRVEASADDKQVAIRLADAAAQALNVYVDRINNTDPATSSIFGEYETAANDLAQAQVAEDGIRSRLATVRAEPVSDLRDLAIASLETDLSTASATTLRAKLKADSAASGYVSSTRGLVNRTKLQTVAAATSTGSDSTKFITLALAAALLAGALIGVGLATLRANWSYLGALRRRPA